MNATSKLVYPGPTNSHRYPCIVVREGVPYGTLLGWAVTPEEAEDASRDFLRSDPVSFQELRGSE